MSDVTRILERAQQGDPTAADELLPLVYEELRKLAAHRLAGVAAGQTLQATAKDLEDSWGQPVTPADLRLLVLRSGRTLEAVYRVLLTGIDGTPMPSFADPLTGEQRWEPVAFIAQLRRDRAASISP